MGDNLNSISSDDIGVMFDVIKKMESCEILPDSPFSEMIEPWSDEQIQKLDAALRNIFGFKDE